MTEKEDITSQSGPGGNADGGTPSSDVETTELAAIIKVLCDADATDDGNAQRLAAFFNGRMRFVPEQRQWYRWDGKRWVVDNDGEVERELRRMAKLMLKVARQVEEEDEKVAKKLRDLYTSIRGKTRMRAAIELAKSVDGVPLPFSSFDRDPYLFNVDNGTIDLRTGELKPHRKEDLLTKMAGTRYVLGAACPIWLMFLRDFCCGDIELMSYLKRIVGYSSTGLVIEHVFHLLIGAGANAKSTLLEALRQVFGDYARQTDFGTFLESKGERIRNDLAGLAGTRLVIAAEADPERAISESTIKQITGGDAISARFLFKEFFEFRPQLKLWLAANHRPRIKRNDRAMWRRLRMIPANADFSDETKRDKDMSKKLEAELPGILVWVVEGALEWQREGLTPPQCVLEATQAYRATEDTVGNFIGEECVLGEKLKVAPKQLADAYKRYCEECAVEPVGQRDFVGYLQSRNLEQTRTGGRRYWVGIGLCDICPI